MPAPLPLYKSNPLGGSGVALKSPTPEYDKLKAYNWMNGLCGTDPSCRASHICASADAAARQQGKLVLPTAEEAALEAARTAKPHGACCDGCAHGTGCEGSAPAPLSSYMPPISASVADLTGPCGGLPYDDEAAAVYSCCAAQSPRPRALKLPTPEEAAAEVAAEGAGSARLGCESPRAALRAPMSGPASPRCGSLGLPVRPTCAHPCSPNYSPRGGYFNPKPTNRCDPDCTASPKRPVSPICRREFVDANVRDRPFSSTLPGSAYAPLCSPPKAPEPLMAPAAGRRYSSPPPARGCSAWPGSAALPSRPMSPSGYAARPYLRDLSPDYARPLSPVRPAMAPAYASNLLPTGPGLTDGRHLQALSPGRRTYCSPFYEPYNVRNTSPRASYLDHLARIEEETQRLRAELRGF